MSRRVPVFTSTPSRATRQLEDQSASPTVGWLSLQWAHHPLRRPKHLLADIAKKKLHQARLDGLNTPYCKDFHHRANLFGITSCSIQERKSESPYGTVNRAVLTNIRFPSLPSRLAHVCGIRGLHSGAPSNLTCSRHFLPIQTLLPSSRRPSIMIPVRSDQAVKGASPRAHFRPLRNEHPATSKDASADTWRYDGSSTGFDQWSARALARARAHACVHALVCLSSSTL